MVTVLLFVALGLAAPCDEPIDAATLGARALEAEQAWAEMESEAFVAQARALGSELSCVSDVLYPDQVAAWFRVQGMLHFYEGNQATALQELHAALANDPSWQLSADLAGPDHPLRALFDEAQERDTAWTQLDKPTDGWLRVDGSSADWAPKNRPWVFQRIDGEGRLVETARVGPFRAPPAYEAAPNWSDARGDRRFARVHGVQDAGRVVTVAGPLVMAVGIGFVGGYGGYSTGFPVVLGIGASALVVGIPMTNLAVSRERRLLRDYGFRPAKAPLVLSWSFYAATWGTLIYAAAQPGYLWGLPPVAVWTVPLWLTSATFSFVAVEQHHRWTRRQWPRVGFGVLPTGECAGLGLVVRGW